MTTKSPEIPARVTVIIPAYNAEAFIRAAIDSVLNQTRPPDELIVIDDGSKDNTPAIIRSYGSRVRLIQQANQGPSVARNRAARETESEWLAFLDADDVFEPTKIEHQLAALTAAPDSVLSYTGLRVMEVDGSETVQAALPASRLPRLIRICNPSIVPSCVMLSRAAMLSAGGFVTNLKGSEDWDLWLRLRKLGPVLAVDEPLTRYRVSNTGLSGNAAHMLGEAESMVEDRLLDGLTGPRRWLWRRRILSYQTYKAALTARASGQHTQERGYLLRSLATWPSPFWEPRRFKVLAVTLINQVRGSSS